MPTRTPTAGPLVAGAALRAARIDRGITVTEAARAIQRHVSTLTRIERAEVPLHDTVLTPLLTHLDLPNRDAAALRALAAQDTGTATDTRPGRHQRLTAAERTADALCIHTSRLVPRPLRTTRYAAATATIEPNDTLFSSHVCAQRTHRRPITALLDESVLHRAVGGPDVLAEQLAHLRRLAFRGLADIRIVPRTAAPPPTLRTVAELALPGRTLLAAESASTVRYATGPAATDLAQLLQTARAGALPARRSTDLMEVAQRRLLTRTSTAR